MHHRGRLRRLLLCEGGAGRHTEALLHAPGEDVAIVPGAADFGPGNIRLTFLIVDSQSRVVTRPKAKVWLAHSLDGKPFLTTTALSERIGVVGGDDADVGSIYVTRFDIPKAGKYWLLAEPVGGRKIQAVGNVVVKDKPAAPDIGDPAVASDTPTLENATIKQVSTSKVPDRELYKISVKDALAARCPSSSRSPRRLLPEPHLRPGRRRRQRGAQTGGRLQCPVHPRRGLPGQRPGKGRKPVVQGVGPAVGAVDVPRRAGRQDPRAVRGHGLGERARRGREKTPARVARNGYAHFLEPCGKEDGMADVLVTTEWLAAHLGDDDLVVAEVDENPDLYEDGHIAGAVQLHWRDDLQDDRAGHHREGRVRAPDGARGIGTDTSVVLYGDKTTGSPPTRTGISRSTATPMCRILDGAARSGSTRAEI